MHAPALLLQRLHVAACLPGTCAYAYAAAAALARGSASVLHLPNKVHSQLLVVAAGHQALAIGEPGRTGDLQKSKGQTQVVLRSIHAPARLHAVSTERQTGEDLKHGICTQQTEQPPTSSRQQQPCRTPTDCPTHRVSVVHKHSQALASGGVPQPQRVLACTAGTAGEVNDPAACHTPPVCTAGGIDTNPTKVMMPLCSLHPPLVHSPNALHCITKPSASNPTSPTWPTTPRGHELTTGGQLAVVWAPAQEGNRPAVPAQHMPAHHHTSVPIAAACTAWGAAVAAAAALPPALYIPNDRCLVLAT